jgi:hypothetical protein
MSFITRQISYFYQELHRLTLFAHQNFSIPPSQILRINSLQDHQQKFLIPDLDFYLQKILNLPLRIASEIISLPFSFSFLAIAVFLIIFNFLLPMIIDVLKDLCMIFGLFFRDFPQLHHFETLRQVRSEF